MIGRYVMPWEIGVSGSWKVQSGRQWGRRLSFAFPGDGTQNVRVEEVTANRAPTVSILDFRVDKSFTFGKFGKVTGMVDVFNVLNTGTVTNFSTVTGATYHARHRHSRPARRPLRRALRLLIETRLQVRQEGPVENYRPFLRTALILFA